MPEGGTGDVKYHHGASGTYKLENGKAITVSSRPNPSHLEIVDPVVEAAPGPIRPAARARAHHDPTVVLPLLIHGDGRLPGQGVVSETLNLQALAGYTTGGTVHIITTTSWASPPTRMRPAPLATLGPGQGLRRADHPRERRRRGGLHRGGAAGHGIRERFGATPSST